MANAEYFFSGMMLMKAHMKELTAKDFTKGTAPLKKLIGIGIIGGDPTNHFSASAMVIFWTLEIPC